MAGTTILSEASEAKFREYCKKYPQEIEKLKGMSKESLQREAAIMCWLAFTFCETQEGLRDKYSDAVKDKNNHEQFFKSLSEILVGNDSALAQLAYSCDPTHPTYINKIKTALKTKKGQDKNLSDGRHQSKINRQTKYSPLEPQLKTAIEDYLNFHGKERKVMNSELITILKKSGFVGKDKYTEKTLVRKAAAIAAKFRTPK